jgi:hypothetical protein
MKGTIGLFHVMIFSIPLSSQDLGNGFSDHGVASPVRKTIGKFLLIVILTILGNVPGLLIFIFIH